MKEPRMPQPVSGFRPQGRGVRRYAAFGLLLAVVLGGTFAIKYARLAGRPVRFAEVERGQLYRCAHPDAESLKYVIRQYRLNTILALENEQGGRSVQPTEEETAQHEGVHLVRIPMPGDAEGWMLALDKAAEVMADPVNRPLLVHCASGVEHTGAAFMAYRLKHGNWSFENALGEGDRFGCGIEDSPELVRSLRDYYRERVLPMKPPASAPAEGAPSE